MKAVGVFSLLGDSVRVVATQTQEVLFKDVGMDALADAADHHRIDAAVEAARPGQGDVDDPVGIRVDGRGERPAVGKVDEHGSPRFGPEVDADRISAHEVLLPDDYLNDVHLRRGLNIHRGRVTCGPVATALGLAEVSAEAALGM